MKLGFDGIECYYPAHTAEVTEACLAVCHARGLMITAGSDCHGAFEKTEIGQACAEVSSLNLPGLCKKWIVEKF